MTLPYADAVPTVRATLRAAPQDFRVVEELGFSADGAGEHVFVQVEKIGANTGWVAEQLARFCGVNISQVSFAGLKDRHAVTEQTFSVQLPGKASPDFSSLKVDGVRVLSSARNSRKLNRGALAGNRFEITLREVLGDRAAFDARIAAIAQSAVPNYFGEQRFGHEHGNLEQARALFLNPRKRVARPLESIYLSAARSEIFNRVLAARVTDGSWNTLLDGDVAMLDGTHSVFGPEDLTAELLERARVFDIHPTGPLWGVGALRTTLAVESIEKACAEELSDLANGLAARGLKQERRSLRLRVANLSASWLAVDVVRVDFALPAGCYATTVIRELALTDPPRA